MSRFDYKIAKGVAIPEEYPGRRPHYPFRDMEVMDSFTCPFKERTKVRSAASNFAKIRNVQFRVISFREEGICRVWRIK